MRFLAASDIHLGRPPARVPAPWAHRYSPRAAWDNLIAAAIQGEADAVLLAGDVADRDDLFFEAYGALQAGLARLREAGIPLIAVAGNHDTRLLPELHDAVADPAVFRLLGRGGTWEPYDIVDSAGAAARIWGWSFPQPHVHHDPLAGFLSPEAHAPAVVLGLLHGDRDQSTSGYAPVSSAALESAGVSLWLLGHTHAPDPIEPNRSSLYLGSLQALDPTETGLHGACWIDCESGAPKVRRERFGELRYDKLVLDAATVQDRVALLQAVTTCAGEIRAQDPSVRALSLRLAIQGESPAAPAELESWLQQAREAEGIPVGDLSVHVEQADLDIRPPLDLPSLAEGRDMVTLLARLLLDLDAGDDSDATAELLTAMDSVIADVDAAPVFAPLAHARRETPAPPARQWLRRQGYALLRELHRQREATE